MPICKGAERYGQSYQAKSQTRKEVDKIGYPRLRTIIEYGGVEFVVSTIYVEGYDRLETAALGPDGAPLPGAAWGRFPQDLREAVQSHDEVVEALRKVLNKPILEVEPTLNVTISNSLLRGRIETLGELILKTPEELINWRTQRPMGRRLLEEIEKVLEGYGLELRESRPHTK